mgnify:CR=1 FL=1
MFIGRNAEMEYLDRFFAKEGSQILVMYGVKGIGKTELLKQYTREKKVQYYMAGAVSEKEQRMEWAGELKESGNKLSDCPEYEEILKVIFPEDLGKKVLVIDEFHHLIKGDGKFIQSLSEFMDKRRMSRPVFVVLLSSAPGFVENTLVAQMGVRATYIDGIYKIRELPFQFLRETYPGYSGQDAFYTYMTLGGVPGSWDHFNPSRSYKDNVIHHILKKGSGLLAEMENYFSEDLREPAVYNTILLQIAQGRCKLNDIFESTGFSRAKISVYLKNLMELDLIEKISAGVYRISVPLLNFYYRFLFPYRTLMEQLEGEAFFEKVIAPALPDYARNAYSKVCRQNYEYENPDGFDISEWYEKGEQLDLVTVDKDSRRVAAICRYNSDFDRVEYKKLISTLRHAKIQPDRLILYSERDETDDLKLLIKKGKIEHIRLNVG